MKTIVLCDTPDQVLSAISFAYEEKEKGNYVDVLIDTLRCPNANMETIIHNLNNADIFSNVYKIKNLQEAKRSIKPVVKIFEWIFPALAYKVMTKGLNIENYDALAVSGPFSTQRCLIAAYPQKPLFYIEDELSSYTGRIGIRQLSWRGKIAQKLFKFGPEKIFPERCFVYRPGFYEGEYKDILQQFQFPIKKINSLNGVFGYDEIKIRDLYYGKRIVFLSQLARDNDYEEEKQETIKALMNYCSDKMIVRPHPRDNVKKMKGVTVDDSGTLWELICANNITETSVLIGDCSTAQFTPKLLFNTEPYLIISMNEHDNSFAVPLIDRLKSLYINKDRLICVKNKEELLEAVRRII